MAKGDWYQTWWNKLGHPVMGSAIELNGIELLLNKANCIVEEPLPSESEYQYRSICSFDTFDGVIDAPKGQVTVIAHKQAHNHMFIWAFAEEYDCETRTFSNPRHYFGSCGYSYDDGGEFVGMTEERLGLLVEWLKGLNRGNAMFPNNHVPELIHFRDYTDLRA